MKYSRLFGASALAAIAGTTTILTGCGSSDDFVFTNTNNNQPIIVAPVAVDDTVTALGNATLNQLVANGVLNNDSVNGATITAFDAVGTQGGTVDLAPDGSFTYSPVFGFTGVDTFTYTLSNAVGTSTATVTVNVPHQGFFVNNTAAPGGNGGQDSPFDTLAPALAAVSPGDTIFVSRGDGTTNGMNGQIDLPQGINFIGEGNGLVVAQEIEPVGQQPTLSGPIIPAGGNTISGFFITGSANDGIRATGVTDLTVTNNTFGAQAEEQIDLEDMQGSVVISDNTFQTPTAGGTGVSLVSSTDVNASIDNNNFSNDGSSAFGPAIEILSSANANVTANVRDNTLTGPDNSNSYATGIYVQSLDTSVITSTITGNAITRNSQDSIFVEVKNAAKIVATMSGNLLTDPAQSGVILINAEGGTFESTASDNLIDSADEDGFQLILAGLTSSTVTMSGNEISNAASEGVTILAADSSENSITFSNNAISNTGSDALAFVAQGGSLNTTVLSENQVSNSGADGFALDFSAGSNSTFTFTSNIITACASDGISALLYGGAEQAIAFRSNTFSTSGSEDINLDSSQGAISCFDITGNSFTGDVSFNQIDAADVNVERYTLGTGGPLDSVNTFNGGTYSESGTVLVDPVAAGSCNIP